jgi:DNA anti-recombination protein RmuC
VDTLLAKIRAAQEKQQKLAAEATELKAVLKL